MRHSKEHAAEMLAKWEKKLKLARKRVQKYRRMLKYRERKVVDNRIAKVIADTSNLPPIDPAWANVFNIELVEA